MIDWKARLRHPATYAAIVGLLMLFVNRFAPVEVGFMQELFTLLGVVLVSVGVIADTSTPGITDDHKD
ncbi:small integral membrane protein [Exiguobacterium phage vB_EauM-23]|nr:small integral membrane protein [Exiguobacterium phage vB_EauM-23]